MLIAENDNKMQIKMKSRAGGRRCDDAEGQERASRAGPRYKAKVKKGGKDGARRRKRKRKREKTRQVFIFCFFIFLFLLSSCHLPVFFHLFIFSSCHLRRLLVGLVGLAGLGKLA